MALVDADTPCVAALILTSRQLMAGAGVEVHISARQGKIVM